MLKKDIPKTVKDLRATLAFTKEQFEAKVGVIFSRVNRWKNGKGRRLSPLAMKRIVEL